MDEIIEMSYGNGKTLEREFFKAYTEVQLDVEIDGKESKENEKDTDTV